MIVFGCVNEIFFLFVIFYDYFEYQYVGIFFFGNFSFILEIVLVIWGN